MTSEARTLPAEAAKTKGPPGHPAKTVRSRPPSRRPVRAALKAPPKGRTVKLKPQAWEQEFISPEGDLLQIRYMLITPELSTAMLDANTRNRKLSPKTAEGYSRSMEKDTWVFVGQPVLFADSGLLLDGQHRLQAIEDTGVSLWMFVLGGLPESVQRFIDIGRARTSAGQLQMDQVHNATNIAAAARLLIQWGEWLDPRVGRVVTPPKNEITDFVHAHVDDLTRGWEAASELFWGVHKGVSRVALTAAYVRATWNLGGPFAIAEFYTKVATGENLQRGDPAYALRDSFLNSTEGDRIPDLAKTVRCWGAEVVGEPLGRYQSPAGGITAVRIPDMRVPVAPNGGQQIELHE